MHTKFCREYEGRRQLGRLGVVGKTTLKYIFKIFCYKGFGPNHLAEVNAVINYRVLYNMENLFLISCATINFSRQIPAVVILRAFYCLNLYYFLSASCSSVCFTGLSVSVNFVKCVRWSRLVCPS